MSNNASIVVSVFVELCQTCKRSTIVNYNARAIFQPIKYASAVIYDRRAFELKNGHQRAGKG